MKNKKALLAVLSTIAMSANLTAVPTLAWSGRTAIRHEEVVAPGAVEPQVADPGAGIPTVDPGTQINGQEPELAENPNIPKLRMGETDTDSYAIGTADEFQWFCEALSAGTLTVLNAHLTSDIDLSGLTVPVSITETYNGIFDGCGHVIRNFSSQTGDELFEQIGYNGIVTNLGLERVQMSETSSMETGILAGENMGLIQNCYVSGTISSVTENAVVSDLCASNSGNIQNCFTSVTHTEAGTAVYGGIAGDNTGAVRNCYYESDQEITTNKNGSLAVYEAENRTASEMADPELVTELNPVGNPEAFKQGSICPELIVNNSDLSGVPQETTVSVLPPVTDPTTAEPTTVESSTAEPTTELTTAEPTTEAPTTAEPTTELTTAEPTTEAPTTAEPTTEAPTTAEPTTEAPTTAEPTTEAPTTAEPTTEIPTTTEAPKQQATLAIGAASAIYYDTQPVDESDFTIVGNEGGAPVTLTFYADAFGAPGEVLASAPVNVGTYWVKASVPETDQYLAAESDYASFSIFQVNPQVTVPAGVTLTAGQTLGEAALPDGWTWDDPTIVPVNGQAYPVTYTPEDTTNYAAVTASVPVTVEVITEAPKQEITLSVQPGGEYYYSAAPIPESFFVVSGNDGNAPVSFQFYADENGAKGIALGSAPENAGSYWVEASVPETDGYLADTSDAVPFSIQKVNPDVQAPASVTAEEAPGLVLSGIPLPDGWEWTDGTIAPVNGTAYQAKYVPEDEQNFSTLTTDVTVILTEAPTTEPTTEATTEAPTTEPTTEATTEAPTTEPTTEATTEAPTTEPTTEATTETPTTAQAKKQITLTVHEKNPYYYSAAPISDDHFRVDGNEGNAPVKLTYYADSNAMKGAEMITPPEHAGFYWVQASVPETENYLKGESQAIRFRINKVYPEVEKPQSAEARETNGLTLSQISLPAGWSWADGTISPVNGWYYSAEYVPENTEDFMTLNAQVRVTLIPQETTTTEVPTATTEAPTTAAPTTATPTTAPTTAAPTTAPTTAAPTTAPTTATPTAAPTTAVPTTAPTTATPTAAPIPTAAPTTTAVPTTTVAPTTTTVNSQKKSISLDVGPSRALVYDGKPVDISDFVVSGNLGNATVSYAFYYERDGGPGNAYAGQPVNAGTYYVVASVPETDEYQSAKSAAKAFTIFPAAPETGTPAPLTVMNKAGLTLADVSLPAGWTWKDPTITPVNGRQYTAVYTPTNSNYKSLEAAVTVHVAENAAATTTAAVPTAAPTAAPTATAAPTVAPTAAAGPNATVAPTATAAPTVAPTAAAGPNATVAPTAAAGPNATVAPTVAPTTASAPVLGITDNRVLIGVVLMCVGGVAAIAGIVLFILYMRRKKK